MYVEVNLCFNTMEAFIESVAYYQKGNYSTRYITLEGILNVKYNTGIGSIHVLLPHTYGVKKKVR